MLQIVNTINSYLSDYILVFLLVAVGNVLYQNTIYSKTSLWASLKSGIHINTLFL